MKKKLKDIRFYKNTDTVDIRAKSIGVHTFGSFDNRGLCIQIRHNGDKELFRLANEIAEKIVEALNGESKEASEVEMIQTFECPFCGFDSNNEAELEDCCDEAQAGGFASDDEITNEYNVGGVGERL